MGADEDASVAVEDEEEAVEDGEEAEAQPEDPRSRSPTVSGRSDLEMNVIGWGVFLLMMVLLIPLLPALLLAIALARLFGIGGRRRISGVWPGRT